MTSEKKIVNIHPGNHCVPSLPNLKCNHPRARVVFDDGTTEPRFLSGHDVKQICEENNIALPKHFQYMSEAPFE